MKILSIEIPSIYRNNILLKTNSIKSTQSAAFPTARHITWFRSNPKAKNQRKKPQRSSEMWRVPWGRRRWRRQFDERSVNGGWARGTNRGRLCNFWAFRGCNANYMSKEKKKCKATNGEKDGPTVLGWRPRTKADDVNRHLAHAGHFWTPIQTKRTKQNESTPFLQELPCCKKWKISIAITDINLWAPYLSYMEGKRASNKTHWMKWCIYRRPGEPKPPLDWQGGASSLRLHRFSNRQSAWEWRNLRGFFNF